MKLLVYLLLLIASPALAHDAEQWIADKHLRDPVSKGFCCGPQDCRVLEDNEVKEVTGGFAIHIVEMHAADGLHMTVGTVDDTVPYNRTLPFSPDNRYHACLDWNYPNNSAKVRCLIIPPGQS